MSNFWGRLMLLGASVVVAGGCDHADEALTKQLLESNDKVVACQKDLAGARAEVVGLKRQLAQAIANPTHVRLTDPDIIQLVASLRGGGGGENLNPTLDPQKASAIVLNGAPALQMCYERALKKNSALQTQAGIGLTLGITVRPTGQVDSVDVVPVVDKQMNECIRSTAVRWKFPPFTGSAVTIEQRVTLTPKT